MTKCRRAGKHSESYRKFLILPAKTPNRLPGAHCQLGISQGETKNLELLRSYCGDTEIHPSHSIL